MKLANAIIIGTATVMYSFAAIAGTGCDCSKLLDQCGAIIEPAGDDIQIKTNTKRCAQVAWYADDAVYSTIVVNGNSSEPAKFKSRPFLSIGSCTICASTHPQSVKDDAADESAECKKRKNNLKLSEKYYAQGRITPYEYQLSREMVKKHCQ